MKEWHIPNPNKVLVKISKVKKKLKPIFFSNKIQKIVYIRYA